MVDCKENITSIFSYIPKEISSEAFFVWLVNLLGSGAKNKDYTQIFLDGIVLKKEDIGRKVASTGIISHEPGRFAVLSFRFQETENDKEVLVLFGNQRIPNRSLLQRYKYIVPNAYRHLYYNMGYVNSIAEEVIAEQTYDLVTSGLVASMLERIATLDPLISMFCNYLQSEANAINTYHEQLFIKHDKGTLCSWVAQEYLLDTVLENIADNHWNF